MSLSLESGAPCKPRSGFGSWISGKTGKRRYCTLAIIGVSLISGLLLSPLYRESGFVYDDELVVVANDFSRDPANVTLLVSPQYYTRSGESTYRPLVTLTYFLDYLLFGVNPQGYHLINVVLHCLTTFGLGLLAVELLGWWGVWTTAVFAFHAGPLEAVAGIAFREDLLAGLFSVAALLSAYRWSGKKSGVLRIAPIAVFYGLALASKESALVTPVIACLLIRQRGSRLPIKRELALFGTFGLVALAFVTLWFGLLPAPSAWPSEPHPVLNRIAELPAVLGFHIKTAVWPTSLSIEHPPVQTDWSSMLLITGFGLLLILTTISNSITGVGLTWFVVALTPVLNLYPPLMNPVAERYLYFPLAGMALAMTAGTKALVTRTGKLGRTAIMLAALFYQVGLPCLLRQDRLADWRDDLTLWQSALRIAPQSARVRFNYGKALALQGNKREALRHLLIADQLSPNTAVVSLNLALLYERFGDQPAAMRYYQQTVDLDPTSYQAHTNLGILLAQRGEYDAAINHFQQALLLRPNSESAILNLQKAVWLKERK